MQYTMGQNFNNSSNSNSNSNNTAEFVKFCVEVNEELDFFVMNGPVVERDYIDSNGNPQKKSWKAGTCRFNSIGTTIKYIKKEKSSDTALCLYSLNVYEQHTSTTPISTKGYEMRYCFIKENKLASHSNSYKARLRKDKIKRILNGES